MNKSPHTATCIACNGTGKDTEFGADGSAIQIECSCHAHPEQWSVRCFIGRQKGLRFVVARKTPSGETEYMHTPGGRPREFSVLLNAFAAVDKATGAAA